MLKRVSPKNSKVTPLNLEAFRVLNLSRVDKAPWNYKKDEEDKARKLTEAIRRNGQIMNLNVRLKDDGRYEVLDGNHRLDSLRALGYKQAIVYDHGSISTAMAQRIALELNEHRFGTDEKKLHGLVSYLQDKFGVADLEMTIPPGLILQETQYRENFSYVDLPDPEIEGDNETVGRFILVYENEVEKELIMEMLDIDDDHVVRDASDWPHIQEISNIFKEEQLSEEE